MPRAAVETHEKSTLGEPPSSSTAVRYTGDYELLDELGHGGMGIVYRARQVSLGREVAFKLIKPGMDSTQLLARFDAERAALARMDHPNIARIFDAGITTAPLTRPSGTLSPTGGTGGGMGRGGRLIAWTRGWPCGCSRTGARQWAIGTSPGPALLRHGTRSGHPDYPLLRRATPAHARAPRPFHGRLPTCRSPTAFYHLSNAKVRAQTSGSRAACGYVVDGALIQGSTGLANPSFTIAALAERCMDQILQQDG